MSIIRTLQTTIEDHCPSFDFEISLEWLSDTRFLNRSEKERKNMCGRYFFDLSSDELKSYYDHVVLNHPFEATQFYGSSQVAINYTKTKFGRNGFQDASDAFRHAMWNGNLTQRIGASRAKVWTDAHEAYSSGIDKQMDLHNNQLGRTIGKNYGSTNPGINVKNMADKIYSEIKAGKGKVIKNNKLVSSKF